MKKKLLYLLNQELDKRNLERLGINFFLKKKYQIYILNNNDNLKIKNKNIHFLHYKNLSESLKIIKNNSKEIRYYLNFSGNSLKEKLAQIYFKKLNIKNIKFELGNIPVPNKIYRQVIFNHFFSEDILNTVKFIMFSIKDFLLSFINVDLDINFISGSSIPKKNTLNVYNHNFDYDLFLKEKKNKHKRKKYILFIDQNFEESFDLKENRYIFQYDKTQYWPPLIKFFKKIKSDFGYDIKILSHPRRKNKKYSKIKFLKNRSFELISNCSAIFAHDSTAIQIPILLNKPIIFVTSNYINKDIYRKNSIKFFSEEIGAKLVNVDMDEISDLKFNFNKKLYKNYINKFVKHKKSKKIITWKKLYKLIN